MPDQIKITIFDSFDAVSSVWNWFEREGDCYAFQSMRWLRNWYVLIGSKSNVQVCLVLVECPEGQPLMLLPLGIRKRGFISYLVWLGGTITDYQAPLLSKDCTQRLSASLFARIWRDVQMKLPHFDAVFLERQPEFVVAQKNPFLSMPCAPHASSAHSTQLSGTLESFIKEKRGSKWNSTERRKERRLAEQGQLAFVVAGGQDDIDRILPAMMRQKSQSYTELGVTDLFEQDRYRDFFKYMSEHHIEDSFVHLSALTLDGRILATHWGLVYKGRFYHLMPTYERGEYTRYSPGNILMRYMFEWCIQNGVQIYDFTVGDEPYKYEWRDQELQLFDCLQPLTMRGFLYVWPISLQRRLKRKIKRSPALSKVFYFCRAQIAKLRHR